MKPVGIRNPAHTYGMSKGIQCVYGVSMSHTVQRVCVALLSFSFLMNIVLLVYEYRKQIVVSVPDGDSLELQDGRRIRLHSVDAPERGRCGADEADRFLKQAALGKRVRLTEITHDDYGRILANVYVGSSFINQDVIKFGYGKYRSTSNPQNNLLIKASDQAITHKLGIYSLQCRSTVPPSECGIKGNIRAGEKTYHLPKCPQYSQVIVDTSFGDVWFCSEEEARSAGFEKAKGCKL